MRLTRTVGLALVVVLATSALATASASAEPPEFGQCVKVAKGTGSFKSSNCTEALAGGSFEWISGPGTANKFTLARTGTTTRVFENVAGTPLICTQGTGTGEYTGPKTVGNVAVTLSACETGSLKCNSAGQPSGTVVLSPQEGSLGIIMKAETPAKDKLGLDLSPVGKGLLVQVECGGLPISIRGSVIVPVVAKSMKLVAPLKFKQAKGKQKPEQFEGEPSPAVLEWNTNGGPFEQAGMGFEATQTNEEKIEINPVV